MDTPADVAYTWSKAEANGWALFPVHTIVKRHCTCGQRADAQHTSAGKHPRTHDGFKSASRSRTDWENWYLGYDGQLNWGVATGVMSNGLLVVDIDGRHNGFTSLEELRDQPGGLPDTLKVTSGSGSPHLYYQLTGTTLTSTNNFKPGIDIKADGGYVVLPPSSHASGGQYLWANDEPIATAPSGLVDLIKERQNHRTLADGVIYGVSDSTILSGVPEGQRDDVLLRACRRWFEAHKGDRGAVSVLAMATAANCQPPFLDWQAKVNSAERYYKQAVAERAVKEQDSGKRHLVLTKASSIKIKPVKWLWNERVALGVISLLGGREGIGKSTVAYDMVARLTKGELAGCFAGTPKPVIVCATEDSWSHTINPRLMAAGADLDLVYRVNVRVSTEVELEISLPDDLEELTRLAVDTGAAMLLLDPLMSRIDGNLDTHKDAEVRRALEPLAKMADKAQLSVLGLIHVNKSSSVDPLNLLMASRAFAAMARAVLFAMADSDDEGLRHLGQAKNNLGKTFELATLDYRINTAHVADSSEGPITTGKIEWVGESERSIRDLLHDGGPVVQRRQQPVSDGTPLQDAIVWLQDFLQMCGGEALSKDVKEFAKKDGHSKSTIERAMQKLPIKVGYVTTGEGPRSSVWTLFTGEKT